MHPYRPARHLTAPNCTYIAFISSRYLLRTAFIRHPCRIHTAPDCAHINLYRTPAASRPHPILSQHGNNTRIAPYGTQIVPIQHLYRSMRYLYRLLPHISPYRRRQASDWPLYDAKPLPDGAKQPPTGSPAPLTHSASLPYQPLAVQHRKRPTKRRQTATDWLPDTTDTSSVVAIPSTGRPTPKIAHQASPDSHGLAPQRRLATQRRHEASPWPNHPAHEHASEAIPPQHGLTTTLRTRRPEARSPEPTSTGTKSLQ